jgi:hypothetical protein
MFPTKFPGNTDPTINYWIMLSVVITVAVGWVILKLTKRYWLAYTKAAISSRVKFMLMLIHLFGSVTMAFYLSNNFLMQVDYFSALYNENKYWIAVSVIGSIFLLLFIIGMIFSLILRIFFSKKSD